MAEATKKTKEQRQIEAMQKKIAQLKVASLSKHIVKCSHCGHEGPAERDFGFRRYKTQINPYTWCRSCRSSPCCHPTTRLAIEPGEKCEHGRLRTADGWAH